MPAGLPPNARDATTRWPYHRMSSAHHQILSAGQTRPRRDASNSLEGPGSDLPGVLSLTCGDRRPQCRKHRIGSEAVERAAS